MPYYRGDFYRGDPGFWSSALGLVKRAAGFIPGVGPIISGVTRAAEIMKPPGHAIERVVGPVVRAVKGHPVLSAAGAAGAVGVGAALMRGGGPAAGMRGFHVSRKTGKVVKNRHMRSTNPRALRRALRRIGGFARLARRVMHYTQPRHKGKLAFKFHRRKK